MGVDTERFSFRPLQERRSEPLQIVTVARLNKTKGHIVALEAPSQLKAEGRRFTHRIAGDGPNQQEITQAIERLRPDGDVELLGSAAESAVVSLLHDSGVLSCQASDSVNQHP